MSVSEGGGGRGVAPSYPTIELDIASPRSIKERDGLNWIGRRTHFSKKGGIVHSAVMTVEL
jgi:hypothetical protein